MLLIILFFKLFPNIIFAFDKLDLRAIVGDTATLPCHVKDRASHHIIWKFYDTLDESFDQTNNKLMTPAILTIGLRQILKDMRIRLLHSKSDLDEKWNLQIQNLQPKDSGVYICKLNIGEGYEHLKGNIMQIRLIVEYSMIVAPLLSCYGINDEMQSVGNIADKLLMNIDKLFKLYTINNQLKGMDVNQKNQFFTFQFSINMSAIIDYQQTVFKNQHQKLFRSNRHYNRRITRVRRYLKKETTKIFLPKPLFMRHLPIIDWKRNNISIIRWSRLNFINKNLEMFNEPLLWRISHHYSSLRHHQKRNLKDHKLSTDYYIDYFDVQTSIFTTMLYVPFSSISDDSSYQLTIGNEEMNSKKLFQIKLKIGKKYFGKENCENFFHFSSANHREKRMHDIDIFSGESSSETVGENKEYFISSKFIEVITDEKVEGKYSISQIFQKFLQSISSPEVITKKFRNLFNIDYSVIYSLFSDSILSSRRSIFHRYHTSSSVPPHNYHSSCFLLSVLTILIYFV
ncbi:hypothetical protein SNEBB_010815 [Seison nebaliae]|nr:hypothetical protein SNEBB_010815 [Seison nebaliae]